MDIRSLNRLSRPVEAALAQATQGQDVPSRRSDSVDGVSNEVLARVVGSLYGPIP
jgi:hypothetical protein